MAVTAQRMVSEKRVSAVSSLCCNTASTEHLVRQAVSLASELQWQGAIAAELWFGGDDDMVTWEPSLKPWLVE